MIGRPDHTTTESPQQETTRLHLWKFGAKQLPSRLRRPGLIVQLKKELKRQPRIKEKQQEVV